MKYKIEHPELVDATSYSKEEIAKSGDEFPERGLYCFSCEVVIPQFRDLNEADEKRIRELIRGDRRMMAMGELRAATGCGLRWAKIWVLHSGRPTADIELQTSCPYCGKSLRTPTARQCRHCLMDWHDSSNPRKLG
jgi:hypothetical protein